MQIKILDVLFSNRVCSLVYMHDTTNLLKKKGLKISHRHTDNFSIKEMIQSPDKFEKKLKRYFKSQFDREIDVNLSFAIQLFRRSLLSLQQN